MCSALRLTSNTPFIRCRIYGCSHSLNELNGAARSPHLCFAKVPVRQRDRPGFSSLCFVDRFGHNIFGFRPNSKAVDAHILFVSFGPPGSCSCSLQFCSGNLRCSLNNLLSNIALTASSRIVITLPRDHARTTKSRFAVSMVILGSLRGCI